MNILSPLERNQERINGVLNQLSDMKSCFSTLYSYIIDDKWHFKNDALPHDMQTKEIVKSHFEHLHKILLLSIEKDNQDTKTRFIDLIDPSKVYEIGPLKINLDEKYRNYYQENTSENKVSKTIIFLSACGEFIDFIVVALQESNSKFESNKNQIWNDVINTLGSE